MKIDIISYLARKKKIDIKKKNTVDVTSINMHLNSSLCNLLTFHQTFLDKMKFKGKQ